MPGDPPESKEFYRFLDTHRIGYDRHDHFAVFTGAQARRMVPPLAAAKTKNLFLRDKKGRRRFERFVALTGHTLRILAVPGQKTPPSSP